MKRAIAKIVIVILILAAIIAGVCVYVNRDKISAWSDKVEQEMSGESAGASAVEENEDLNFILDHKDWSDFERKINMEMYDYAEDGEATIDDNDGYRTHLAEERGIVDTAIADALMYPFASQTDSEAMMSELKEAIYLSPNYGYTVALALSEVVVDPATGTTFADLSKTGEWLGEFIAVCDEALATEKGFVYFMEKDEDGNLLVTTEYLDYADCLWRILSVCDVRGIHSFEAVSWPHIGVTVVNSQRHGVRSTYTEFLPALILAYVDKSGAEYIYDGTDKAAGDIIDLDNLGSEAEAEAEQIWDRADATYEEVCSGARFIVGFNLADKRPEIFPDAPVNPEPVNPSEPTTEPDNPTTVTPAPENPSEPTPVPVNPTPVPVNPTPTPVNPTPTPSPVNPTPTPTPSNNSCDNADEQPDDDYNRATEHGDYVDEETTEKETANAVTVEENHENVENDKRSDEVRENAPSYVNEPTEVQEQTTAVDVVTGETVDLAEEAVNDSDWDDGGW